MPPITEGGPSLDLTGRRMTGSPPTLHYLLEPRPHGGRWLGYHCPTPLGSTNAGALPIWIVAAAGPNLQLLSFIEEGKHCGSNLWTLILWEGVCHIFHLQARWIRTAWAT